MADGEQVKELQRQVRDVHVDRSVGEYIVEIVQSTRRVEHVALGCSPRASLYLMRAAQALALYNGRDYVIPDDVKSLVIPVLAHRMVLKQEAKIRKLTAESILSDLLKDVRVPV